MNAALRWFSVAFGKGDEASSWSGPLADPPDRPEVSNHFHGRSPGSRIEPAARLPGGPPPVARWAPVSAYSCGGSSGLGEKFPAPYSLLSPRGDHGHLNDAPAARACQQGHKDFFISSHFTTARPTMSELCRNPLTRIPNRNTTSSVSWSPGSQGRVIIGKPVRAIAPVRRCPRNCDSRRKPASQIPATTG